VFIALHSGQVIRDEDWQQQGAALAQHWCSIPDAPTVYAQSLNSMPAF